MQRRRWWRQAMAAGALLTVLLAACGRDGADVTPSPTAAPSTPTAILPGTATATPLPSPELTPYRFLYSEFGTEEDIIWRINPADPSDRVEVAKVPHKSGSAVVAALSPDGKKIAYNAMPEAGIDSSRDAETHILDLKSKETTLVAEGVDLQTVPHWSPDGGLLFLRRNLEDETTIILVQLFKSDDEHDGEEDEQQQSVVITLTGSDADTCELIFETADPVNGTLSEITDNPCVAGSPNTDSATVTFTSEPGVCGPAQGSFTYTTNDGSATSAPATVTVDIPCVDVGTEEAEEGEEGEEGEEKPPPIRTVLRQHVSDVRIYELLGFDAKEATMYFVQVEGGTQGGTSLGRYAPATGEAVATATAEAEATATAEAEITATAEAAATATAEAEATAAGGSPTPTPTPTPTPSPIPTPTPSPVLTGSVFLLLSDQTALDYSLSPDSSRVVFLVPSLVEGKFVFRTHIADIKTEQVSPLSAEGLPGGRHLHPLWHPDGDKVSVGQLPAGPNPGRVALVPLDGGKVTSLTPPDKGFDVPLSWSPDGKFLAVKSFPGDSLVNSGPERLVFLAQGGRRLPAPKGAETRPVGWLRPQ